MKPPDNIKDGEVVNHVLSEDGEVVGRVIRKNVIVGDAVPCKKCWWVRRAILIAVSTFVVWWVFH